MKAVRLNKSQIARAGVRRSSKRRQFPAAPPATISDQDIYDRIWNAIGEHRLPPGTKLGEDKLGKIFGVSRTRIRQTISRLAHERIITLMPNRGAFVAKPSVAEAHEVFEARRFIEPSVIERVVETANARDIARLKEHVALESAARRANERGAIIKLSGDFHVLLAELTGNMMLSGILREFISLTRLIIFLYDSAALPACLSYEHTDLVDAIERRDAAHAKKFMIQHLERVEGSLNLNIPATEVIDLEAALASSGP